MLHPRKEPPKEKVQLHLRNYHRERYDFKILTDTTPELAQWVKLNRYGDESIDFFNPEAVKILNKALLKHYYGIDHWDIPPGYLCPPIPGRADYILNVADLLGSCNNGEIPTGNLIRCLDIGVGANCIYPIIGSNLYGWSFVGSDNDPVALESAGKIIESNPLLKDRVELRLQLNSKEIFNGIIRKDERFDLSVCNPPFHRSFAEAQSGTVRKLSHLSGKIISRPVLNFGGQSGELWCEGGEAAFVRRMVSQSKQFSASCFWFSSLISKASNLPTIYSALKLAEAVEVRTIPMGQGNKTSRVVAWTFFSPAQQKEWVKSKWNIVLR